MKTFGALMLSLILSLFVSLPASAFTVEQVKGVTVVGDFAVGPGKTEMTIKPGETSIKNITVLNRMGQQMKFNLKVEDFTSSKDPRNTVQFLGDEKGPYSLKDFITLDTSEIVLQQGDRANIPVKISIPADAQPGGLYGMVAVTYSTTDPLVEQQLKEAEAKSGVGITARVANLFFIRVPGPVKEEGNLSDLYTDKKIYGGGPVTISWMYENSGNVYVNPFGYIEIKNLYGQVVHQEEIAPYFVMPGSLRLMENKWSRPFMFGRYTVDLKLNRGYGNIVDERTIAFWVLPWKIVAMIVAGIFLLIAILFGIKKWFNSKYEKKPRSAK